MPGLLGIAASGMRAQQFRLDIIANNLANIDTVGYKSARAEFQDAEYELKIITAGSGDIEATTEAWLGNGVTSGSRRILIQGAIQETGIPSDMAISGNGFFQVRLADGALAYTRDGSFSVDLNGQLVTHNGNFLEPPVTLPAGAVDMRIAPDGQVTATVPGQIQSVVVAQIDLAQFPNSTGLEAIGLNLFIPTVASGDPALGTPGAGTFGTIRSGMLELSNVDLAGEMTALIQAQRAYQMNVKSLQTIDEMIADAISMAGP